MKPLQKHTYQTFHSLRKRSTYTLISILFLNNYTFSQINGGGVTDIDGNQYSTVIIGNQEWMAENLNTTKYANVDIIEHTTDNTYWAFTPVGMWRHYNDSVEHELTYGKWYNWYSVIDPRNICPSGWHVPFTNEWDSLAIYLGGAQIAGGKMKETGFSHWHSPNGGATNTTGFTALPGGSINGINFINSLNMGGWAEFWTCTPFNDDSGVKTLMNSYNANLTGGPAGKNNGLSVRCIKDVSPLGLQNFQIEKNIEAVRIVDIMGRDMEYESEKLLFIIYSDGSVEKVFKMNQP